MCKPRKQLLYLTMLERGQRHPQRLTEIFECFIVSSVAKDCLALSQYDLHHGSFLLVTPIVMSNYKSTITHCKSTSLRWHALLSKLGSKSGSCSQMTKTCKSAIILLRMSPKYRKLKNMSQKIMHMLTTIIICKAWCHHSYTLIFLNL